MSYFVVFDKRGLVQHEEGIRPIYLASFIRSIDPLTASLAKEIRDDTVEYEIRGQTIYLSVGHTGTLQRRIEELVKSPNSEGSTKGLAAKKRRSVASELAYGAESVGVAEQKAEPRKFDFKRAFSLFSGKMELDAVHARMNNHLVGKNVDASFARIISDDVVAEFRREGLERVSEGAFRAAMQKVISGLVPSVDHARLVERVRRHGPGFTLCFVGVNGVGKSTSLAKTACWLLQQGLRVFVAACDTFRAGAVEQLKIHVARFRAAGYDVGLYEAGYNKDDAAVARAAIQRGTREGYDVVLIDTAGRMHNKEHLMRSLGKLVKVNSPDHIVFVGEALVGGDSLAHIREFNKWIGASVQGRSIDSIFLTKADTVESKIGQVLNLSFSASAPVLFLGVGQTNSDILQLDAALISDLLMS